MEIIITWLLDGDTLAPEMCLRQPGFTWRPFKNNKAGMQKFKETEDIRYLCHSELGNVCFQYDMAYGAHKYLPIKPTFERNLS